MNKNEIKHDLDELEKKIEQLKVDYEKFFMGIIPIEPLPLKTSIQQIIKKYSSKQNLFNNVMLTFRYRNLTARFLTYQEYWNRILRLIEEGKNPKDYRRLTEPSKVLPKQQFTYDKYKELYLQYSELLKGLKKEPPTEETFKKTIAKYEDDIKAKYGKDVKPTFSFEKTDNTVKIKTKIKRQK